MCVCVNNFVSLSIILRTSSVLYAIFTYHTYKSMVSHGINSNVCMNMYGMCVYVCVCFKVVYVLLTTGCDQQRKCMQLNFEDKCISELCDTTEDGSCHVHIFSEAKELDPYLLPLWVFSHKHRSAIFHVLWKCQVEKSRTLPSMTLTDVINLIWDPVFKQCNKIVEDLLCWTITLSQVDHIFKQYSLEHGLLVCEIKSLCQAVQECSGEPAADLEWIESRITKMQHYWELCSYQDTAVAFRKIKDSLQLTGDFTLVETVAAKVFCFG